MRTLDINKKLQLSHVRPVGVADIKATVLSLYLQPKWEEIKQE